MVLRSNNCARRGRWWSCGGILLPLERQAHDHLPTVVTLEGPPEEVAPWALEITEAVNKTTKLNVSLWQGLFGGPIGTLGWSAAGRQPDGVGGGHRLARRRREVPEPGVKGEGLDDDGWRGLPLADRSHRWRRRRPPGGGRLRRGRPPRHRPRASWPKPVRSESTISDIHSKLTHSSVLFCTCEYGTFGEMRWLALYDSAAAVDAAAEAIAKDAGLRREARCSWWAVRRGHLPRARWRAASPNRFLAVDRRAMRPTISLQDVALRGRAGPAGGWGPGGRRRPRRPCR